MIQSDTQQTTSRTYLAIHYPCGRCGGNGKVAFKPRGSTDDQCYRCKGSGRNLGTFPVQTILEMLSQWDYQIQFQCLPANFTPQELHGYHQIIDEIDLHKPYTDGTRTVTVRPSNGLTFSQDDFKTIHAMIASSDPAPVKVAPKRTRRAKSV